MKALRKARTAVRLLLEHGPRGLTRYALRRYKYPFLQRYARVFPGSTPIDHPHVVQVEVSSKCNLRCPSCSLTRELVPGRTMSLEELQTLLDRLPFLPDNVSLNGIGEPLVNQAIFRMIDHLGERGASCTFYTNGTLLSERNRTEILKRSNITFIGISCDGASTEVFEKLRFGADFSRWQQNVRAFVAAARERKPLPIRVAMSTVLSRDNQHEVCDIVRLAAELGFGSIQLSDVVPNDETSAAMALAPGELDRGLRDRAIALGEELGITVGFSSLTKKARPHLNCLQPWEYVQISAEGDVLPCCAIVGSDKAAVMGNLHQQSFAEIWRGEPFRHFRETAVRGTNELCNHCPYY